MKSIAHQDFTGKGKKEVITLMGGDEFNYYPSQVWTYYLKKKWWGQRVFLLIYFEEDVVVKTMIIKTFKKAY